MSIDVRHLERVSCAVADGDVVDWAAAESSAPGAGERQVLEQLRSLSPAIRSAGHVRTEVATRLRVRVSGWIQPLLWLAFIRVVTGLAGIAAAPSALGVRSAPKAVYVAQLLAYGVSAAALLYGGRHERRSALLGGFYLLVASSFADGLIAHNLAVLGDAGRAAAAVVHDLRPEAFLPLLFWLFVAVFPTVPVGAFRQRVARALALVSFVVGCVLFAGDAALAWWPQHLPALARNTLDSRGTLSSFYWTAVFLVALPAVPVMLWKAGLARPEDRRRVKIFATALAVGLAPIILITFAARMNGTVNAWRIRHFVSLGWVVHPFLLSIPLTTAYSVLVHHVLDVRLVVRRALQYALARYTLLALSCAPVLLFAAYLGAHSRETIGDLLASRTALALGAVALSGPMLMRLRRHIMSAVDLALFRERHDPAPVLARFGEISRTTRSARGVATALLDEIEHALHPESSAVLVSNGSRFAPLAGAARPLPADSALACLLSQSQAPLAIDLEDAGSFARLLPADELEWLGDGPYRLLLPLANTEGVLIGMLALAAKQSELPYSDDDVLMTRALASSAAVAISAHWTDASGRAAGDRLPVAADDVAAECERCGRVVATEEAACPCGGRLREAALPQLLLGKFHLERRVGAGGMGVVYRGTDVALGRVVAIKTLPRLSIEASGRMRREARMMAAVVHPGLALIFGAESWRGTPMLVVEFLEGGTLADRLRVGALAIADAVSLGVQLTDALDHVHRAGIVHGDIKPSNIGFTAAAQPKLLDFGLARLIEDEHDQERGLGCTPLYLAPEALHGAESGPAFDLWAVSLTLYEAIAGTNPLRGQTLEATLENVRRAAVPDIRTLRPDAPAAVAAFFARALAKDPRGRPRSAALLRAALERVRTTPND